MAGITGKALRRLLPRGMAWRPFGMFSLFLDALELELARLRAFILAIPTESIPKTAVDLLPEWHAALGLALDPTKQVWEQQARIDANYTATGGASLDYVNAQLQREFPDVVITEVSAFAYNVDGMILKVSDLTRLYGLVERFVSLHLQPTYGIVIIESLDTAYTGAAICGKAITARTVEA